jgi:hypothetical protein
MPEITERSSNRLVIGAVAVKLGRALGEGVACLEGSDTCAP